jgi:hypothetical protein
MNKDENNRRIKKQHGVFKKAVLCIFKLIYKKIRKDFVF